jgi:hypothetical protein
MSSTGQRHAHSPKLYPRTSRWSSSSTARRLGFPPIGQPNVALIVAALSLLATLTASAEIGREVAVERHLANGEEYTIEPSELIAHGQLLFDAKWTEQEGAGRPLSKGTGQPLADPSEPLVFPRNHNRVSAPDANGCSGCHNTPRSGGGGDVVANVFVLGQRFDFATFDDFDTMPTKGNVDERGDPVMLQTIANERNTLGMFGSGFIEMLARQMTEELQLIRDSIQPGGVAALVSKGVSFGTLSRDGSGHWNVNAVEGLPPTSLRTTGPADPPSLVLRPFHQAGAVVSLREFTNGAFNHHHGIQSEERFGAGQDPDGDGFTDEMTRADMTAATLYQATLAVPGRVIPNDPDIEQAVLVGETRFVDIGCADCHVPELPIDRRGWIFFEPNPFNPPGNLRPGEAPPYALDLTDPRLDLPRLPVIRGPRGGAPSGDGIRPPWSETVLVPAYTDLKLHDITEGLDDPNREPLNMHMPAGSPEFFGGNGRFLTRKLWGVANEPPYFHHGKYTTLRTAVEAHHGEAQYTTDNWWALSSYEQDAIIEFLKTLQVLPKGTPYLTVDENYRYKPWPPGTRPAKRLR